MSEDLALVLAIFLLGGITYCYRFSFISARGEKIAEKIPIKLLNLLGPASFAAIVAANFLSSQNDPTLFKEKIFVGSLAMLVAYFTRSMIATLMFGLIALYLLRLYF